MKENDNITTSAPKTKKRYITLKFIILIIVSLLVGAVVGGLASSVSDNFGGVYAAFEKWLILVIPSAQWIWLGLSTLASILLYLSARTTVFAFERGGSESEEMSLLAEKLLSIGMLANQLCMTVGYGLFGVACALPYSINNALLGGVACVLVIIVFYSVYWRVSVNLFKRLSPEKQGDPLDIHFTRDWLSSCDEAEKMRIGEAAYISYKATNMALLAVWLVTVIVGIFGSIGIYPIVVITVIWLVQTLSYQLHSIASYGSKKRKKSNC